MIIEGNNFILLVIKHFSLSINYCNNALCLVYSFIQRYRLLIVFKKQYSNKYLKNLKNVVLIQILN